MDSSSSTLRDVLPTLLQPIVLICGVVVSAIGAQRLDAAYPLGFQMEPWVGTPFVAWGVFWLGVGIVIFGLGMADSSVMEVLSVFRFSERQRKGLMVSGLIIILPSLSARAGNFVGFLFLYATVPAGLAGVATVIVWRVVELVRSRRRQS